MKVIVTIIILISFFFGLIHESLEKEKFPILISTKDSTINSQLEFKNNRFSDTIKIVVAVEVFFKNPLFDTTQVILVDSVRIHRIYELSDLVLTKNVRDYFPENKSSRTPDQEYIWNICQENFSSWLPYQPYERIWDRQEYGRELIYKEVVYFVPE